MLILLTLIFLGITYVLFPGYISNQRILIPMNRILFDKSFNVPEHFQNVEMVSPMLGTFGGPNVNGPSKILPTSCYWYQGRLFCKNHT